ncbi:Adenylate cyclase type 10 [Blyttiomyces sp. JEL0837]|nr:Adenylate cyclase type 10 [Blyttiomyces sp. JEL0837]
MDDVFASLVPKTIRYATAQTNSRSPSQDSATSSSITPLPRKISKAWPVCVESLGCVAIIDLSGYTNLTEILFETGSSNGGERVYNTVNPFFDGIINLCNQYDGDVIKFCGDALIVAWPAFSNSSHQDVEQRQAITRALACSMEIIQKFGSYNVVYQSDESPSLMMPTTTTGSEQFQSRGPAAAFLPPIVKSGIRSKSVSQSMPGPNTMSLGVHIGIGCGKIFHHFVGKKKGRCEYFILGEAIEKAAEVLQKRTDIDNENRVVVIISSIAGLKLDGLSNLIRKFSSPAIIPCSLGLLPENFIMESALSRLSDLMSVSNDKKRLQSQLNELRRVIVVFLKINSPQLRGTLKEQSKFTQSIFQIVNNFISKFNGHLRQIVYDDKGFTVLLVWGLPPASSRDEQHALSCCLRLRDTLLNISSLQFSIGMSAGKSYVGFIGSDIRQDYNLFGRCVNLAARYMTSQLASQSILCDSVISTATSGSFQFGEKVSLKLKGVRENRTVQVLFREQRKNSFQFGQQLFENSILFGRDKETKILLDSIDVWLMEMKETLIIVEGDAGIGKSAFADLIVKKLKRQIDLKNILYLEASATEITKHYAFHIFRTQVFPTLFGLLYDNIDTLKNLQIPNFDMPLPTPTTSDLAKFKKLTSMTNVSDSNDGLDAAIDNTLMDMRSLHVREVARSMNVAEHLLPLFNIMIEGSSAGKRALVRKLLNYVVTLATSRLNKRIVILIDNYQWSDSNSQAYVNQSCEEMAEKLIGKKLHPSLLVQIFEKSGGIPLVIKTLIVNLLHSKALVGVDGMMKLDKSKEQFLLLDETSSSFILPQYDALSASFREVIGVASVLGTSFTPEDIDFIRAGINHDHAKQPQEIVDLIQHDDVFQFLVSIVDGDVVRYQFRTGFIQRAIYSLILKKTRDQIHLIALKRNIDLLEKSLSLDSETSPNGREMSQSENELLLDINYHLDHINVSDARPNWFCRYKGLLLEYFYDRQMVWDCVRVYEQLIQYLECHPAAKIPNLTRAKYAVFLSELYFMNGESVKGRKCSQDAIFYTIGRKLPESNLGKLGYFLKKLFGGKLTTVAQDIKNIDFNSLELESDFCGRLEDPMDILAESFNIRTLADALQFETLDLLASVAFCAAYLKSAPLQRPLNIYRLNLTTTYSFIGYVTDKDVIMTTINAKIHIGAKLRDQFAITPSLPQLTFQFWLVMVSRTVCDFENAERYALLAVSTADDLQVPSSRLAHSSKAYLREIWYVLGRFDDLRAQIEPIIAGIRPVQISREYAFGQEIAYQSEMMDRLSAHHVYNAMMKIASEDPPLVPLLKRDVAIYELFFRIGEVISTIQIVADILTDPADIVTKACHDRAEPAVQALITSSKNLMRMTKKVPEGPTIRALITFRAISMWVFHGLLSLVCQETMLSRTLGSGSKTTRHDIWGFPSCVKFIVKLLKIVSTMVTTSVESYLSSPVTTLFEALTFIVKGDLNVGVEKWESAVGLLSPHEEKCKYFILIMRVRLTILRVIICGFEFAGRIRDAKGGKGVRVGPEQIDVAVLNELMGVLTCHLYDVEAFGRMANLEVFLIQFARAVLEWFGSVRRISVGYCE